MTPFLTVFTRTCKRPKMLSDLIDNLKAQTDTDFEQVFVVDKVGNHSGGNVKWANNQIPANKHRVDGEYVYFLDDDKAVIYPYFIAELKEIARYAARPEIILVRSVLGSKSDLGHDLHFNPHDEVWSVEWEKGERPNRWIGHALNYVVRRDYWLDNVDAYRNKERGGDWHFGTAITLDPYARVVRLDRVVSASLQRGMGRRFERCEPGWFERVAKHHGIEDLGKGDWRLRMWKRGKR